MFIPSCSLYLRFIFLEKEKRCLCRMDDSEESITIAEYIVERDRDHLFLQRPRSDASSPAFNETVLSKWRFDCGPCERGQLCFPVHRQVEVFHPRDVCGCGH